MGKRNLVLKSMGHQAKCKVKVDHVEGPQHLLLWTLQSSKWFGPNHGNIIIETTNDNLNACHGPCLISLISKNIFPLAIVLLYIFVFFHYYFSLVFVFLVPFFNLYPCLFFMFLVVSSQNYHFWC